MKLKRLLPMLALLTAYSMSAQPKSLMLAGTNFDSTVAPSNSWIANSNESLAQQFTLDTTVRVTQITLNLFVWNGAGNYQVQLTDGLGTGNVYATQGFNSPPQQGLTTTTFTTVTLTLPKPATLQAGNYYVVLSSSDSQVNWLTSTSELSTAFGSDGYLFIGPHLQS